MNITKVFTKYDEPFSEIIIPEFLTIKAMPPLNDNTSLATLVEAVKILKTRHLLPTKRSRGLGGVTFIKYSD